MGMTMYFSEITVQRLFIIFLQIIDVNKKNTVFQFFLLCNTTIYAEKPKISVIFHCFHFTLQDDEWALRVCDVLSYCSAFTKHQQSLGKTIQFCF